MKDLPSKLVLVLLNSLAQAKTKYAQRAKINGAVLPYVIFAVLVVMVSAAVLMTRGSTSFQNSIANSDHQAAKEAAESGFNEILAALNTDARSYLLVTDLSNWSTVTKDDTTRCNVYATATLGGAPDGVSTKQQLSTESQFYQLAAYTAPVRSPGSTGITNTTPPVDCSIFGNLFGGSADVVVIGTVERGGQTVATYRLKRTVYVKGPYVESSLPPQTPLVITGPVGSTLGKFDQNNFGLATSPNLTDLKIGATKADAACLTVEHCITDNTKVGDIDARSIKLPSYPTLAELQDRRNSDELTRDSTLVLAFDNVHSDKYTNFPYTNQDETQAASSSSPYLARGCYFNNYSQPDNSSAGDRPPQESSGSTAINCVAGSLNNPNIIVDTEELPVNVFIVGASSTLKPGNSADIRFDNKNLANWQRLRIYGQAAELTNTCSGQTFTVNANPFSGAFVWLPNAAMVFEGSGTGGGQAGSYGVRWLCRLTGPTSGDTGLYGPMDATAGLNEIFIDFFNTATNDSYDPSPIPSGVTNYRAYGITY